MANADYRVEAGDPATDGPRVIGVWHGNLGRPERLQAKYDRFYRRCPWGEPTLRLLRHVDEEAVVGVATAGPRRMRLAGRTIEAGVLADLAVLPAHRSLFPALMLEKALMNDGLARFELLYGFPNPKAAPVFKRLGYKALGPIERHVAVVRTRTYLERHMPAFLAVVLGAAADLLLALRHRLGGLGEADLEATWCDGADERMDALWAASPPGAAPVTERVAAFLNWQFEPTADNPYRFYCLSRRGSRDLVAWFACRSEGRTLRVADFWSVDGTGGLRAAFLWRLQREARARGLDSVSIEYFGSPAIHAALRATGFVPRSSRPIYYLPSPRLAQAGGIGHWHLTSADEDE